MKRTKLLLNVSLGLLLLPLAPFSLADIVVVVHPDNPVQLEEKQVRKIFLSKVKSFPDGNKVDVFDLPEGNEAREEFRHHVLRKSASRLHSYWARMLFSSKAQPPQVLTDAEAIRAQVAANRYAIAYLNAEDVDSSIRVLMRRP